MSLYKLLTILIENNKTHGLSEKIDFFYAANKLTKEEYEEIIKKL